METKQKENIKDKVDLYKLYNEYNKVYFDDKLPKVITLIWNDTYRSTAGKCNHRDKIIKLSSYYHNLHPEELERTLVHEMIHLIEPNHKEGFKREAKRITDMGLEIMVYTKYSERKEPKWNYVCKNPECGNVLVYRRRLPDYKDYVCSECMSPSQRS